MTKEQLIDLLGKFDLRPNKTFGQNFLLSEDVLDTMVKGAGMEPGDAVLEVGPGIGNLTKRLCGQAGFVLAVEKDRAFEKLLLGLAAGRQNLRVEFADILRYDFVSRLVVELGVKAEDLNYKVVANLPYYLTGKVLQMFLRHPVKRPSSICVLIQKEVAENMTAGPGKMNLLSLSVGLVGQAELLEVVPAKCFYPAPKVNSAIVQVKVAQIALYPGLDEKQFFRVAKATFSGKRKQIHNTLSAGLHLTPAQVASVLETAGLDKSVRPQQLSVADFVKLTDAINSRSII